MTDWTNQYQHQFRIITSEEGVSNIRRNSIHFRNIRRLNSESQIYWSQSKSFEALQNKQTNKKRNIGKLLATHLNPGLCETNSHGDLLSHENIRVMSLGEATLQFVQLCWRKASPMSLLFRRFFRVGGRARRQTLLLLLLLSCLLWGKSRGRLAQWGSSQATGVMVRIAAVVQRGGFQFGMVTL